MFKDVLRSLDTGALPQIGLVAFCVAFGCIVLYAFTLSRARRDRFAALPLEDALPADLAHALDAASGDGARSAPPASPAASRS